MIPAFIAALVPKNWRLLLLGAAAALVGGFLFYLWAYERGRSACEAKIAQANAEALLKNSAANSAATSLEMALAIKRAENQANLLNSIEVSHEASDDAPAAPVLQRALDGVRRLDSQAAGHR